MKPAAIPFAKVQLRNGALTKKIVELKAELKERRRPSESAAAPSILLTTSTPPDDAAAGRRQLLKMEEDYKPEIIAQLSNPPPVSFIGNCPSTFRTNSITPFWSANRLNTRPLLPRGVSWRAVCVDMR
jgi:hypothetical protein